MMAIELSRPVNLLVIHHSATRRDASPAAIREGHLRRGWEDVGYHWLIDWNGAVTRGRPLKKPGAHAAGYNTHSVGICVIGDNTHEAEKWSPRQVGALVELVAGFRVWFPVAEIVGHRDLHGAKTLCPGVDVRALLRARGVK